MVRFKVTERTSCTEEAAGRAPGPVGVRLKIRLVRRKGQTGVRGHAHLPDGKEGSALVEAVMEALCQFQDCGLGSYKQIRSLQRQSKPLHSLKIDLSCRCQLKSSLKACAQ